MLRQLPVLLDFRKILRNEAKIWRQNILILLKYYRGVLSSE